MTSQFDFSNDQWDKLAAAPYLVGLAVAKAENSGLLGSARETRTLLASIEARPGASAAASLVAEAATTDVTDHYERFRAESAETLADQAVKACGVVAAVLAEVADPAEAEGFKQWLLDVAWTVAEAAKEHGQRVSPGEAALLERISGALGIAVTP